MLNQTTDYFVCMTRLQGSLLHSLVTIGGKQYVKAAA